MRSVITVVCPLLICLGVVIGAAVFAVMTDARKRSGERQGRPGYRSAYQHQSYPSGTPDASYPPAGYPPAYEPQPYYEQGPGSSDSGNSWSDSGSSGSDSGGSSSDSGGSSSDSGSSSS